MRLEWTFQAEKEMMAILSHIAEDDPDAADRIEERVQNAASGLLIFPKKGSPGRWQGTRELFVKPRYYLVYVLRGDTIKVVTVFDTSRNYPDGFHLEF